MSGSLTVSRLEVKEGDGPGRYPLSGAPISRRASGPASDCTEQSAIRPSGDSQSETERIAVSAAAKTLAQSSSGGGLQSPRVGVASWRLLYYKQARPVSGSLF